MVFGPKPRDYQKTVPQAIRVLATRKALGERLKAGDVTVVNELTISSPKTKEFVKLLDNLKMEGTVLVGCQFPTIRMFNCRRVTSQLSN